MVERRFAEFLAGFFSGGRKVDPQLFSAQSRSSPVWRTGLWHRRVKDHSAEVQFAGEHPDLPPLLNSKPAGFVED